MSGQFGNDGNPKPHRPQAFKSGAEWTGNAKGRPKLDRTVRKYLDTKMPFAVRKVWALCSNPDAQIALAALNLFLRKCLPDLKPVERRALEAETSPLPEGATMDDVRELAKLRKRLEAQVADEPEPH